MPDSEPTRRTVAARSVIARDREVRAWGMRVQGRTQNDIARELGVTRTGVRKILERIEARTLKQLASRVKATKARQSAQLEFLLSEAMAAWERSKRPARKRRTKTVTVETDAAKGQTVELPAVETTRETAWQVGDPRFLAEARAILESERALWGIGKGGETDAAAAGGGDGLTVPGLDERWQDHDQDQDQAGGEP